MEIKEIFAGMFLIFGLFGMVFMVSVSDGLDQTIIEMRGEKK